MKISLYFFKFITLIALPLLGSLFGCTSKSIKSDLTQTALNPPRCPRSDGVFLLPNTFPAQEIYIGFFEHELQVSLIQDIIKLTSSKSIPVKVVAPKDLVELAQLEILNSLSADDLKRVKVIAAPTQDSVWMQDYLDMGYHPLEKSTHVIEVPYDRDGQDIASVIAQYLKSPLVPRPRVPNLPYWGDNGDYGGNIEALSAQTVMVGSNMNPIFRRHLEKSLQQKFVTVNTNWLEPGHVDEIFLVLPVPAVEKKCQKILLYASPTKAFEVLKNKDLKTDNFHVSDPSVEELFNDRTDFRPCLRQINWTTLKTGHPECREFIRANKTYDAIIKADLNMLADELKTDRSCELVKTVAIPILFSPFFENDRYGGVDDRAITLNPNPINAISINDQVFMASQPFKGFSRYLLRELKPLGLNLHFVETNHLYSLQGGIHCSSNVRRVCP